MHRCLRFGTSLDLEEDCAFQNRFQKVIPQELLRHNPQQRNKKGGGGGGGGATGGGVVEPNGVPVVTLPESPILTLTPVACLDFVAKNLSRQRLT